MQTLWLLIIFIMLAVCFIDDINFKKVNVLTVIVLGLSAFLLKTGLHVYETGFYDAEIIKEALLGMMPGIMLYILSKLKLGVGEADGIIFIAVGISLGIKLSLEIMLLSFFLAFLFSLFLLSFKKKDKTYTYAFAPFVLISFCVAVMKSKYKSGSMTIELSLIMPGIMAVLILIIFMAYFLHDKCVIKRAAYIACLREASADNGYDENRVYESFDALTSGRLLGRWQLTKSMSVNDGKITMNVYGNMSSPLGILGKYLKNSVFSVNMDAYSYIKPT